MEDVTYYSRSPEAIEVKLKKEIISYKMQGTRENNRGASRRTSRRFKGKST